MLFYFGFPFAGQIKIRDGTIQNFAFAENEKHNESNNDENTESRKRAVTERTALGFRGKRDHRADTHERDDRGEKAEAINGITESYPLHDVKNRKRKIDSEHNERGFRGTKEKNERQKQDDARGNQADEKFRQGKRFFRFCVIYRAEPCRTECIQNYTEDIKDFCAFAEDMKRNGKEHEAAKSQPAFTCPFNKNVKSARKIISMTDMIKIGIL